MSRRRVPPLAVKRVAQLPVTPTPKTDIIVSQFRNTVDAYALRAEKWNDSNFISFKADGYLHKAIGDIMATFDTRKLQCEIVPPYREADRTTELVNVDPLHLLEVNTAVFNERLEVSAINSEEEQRKACNEYGDFLLRQVNTLLDYGDYARKLARGGIRVRDERIVEKLERSALAEFDSSWDLDHGTGQSTLSRLWLAYDTLEHALGNLRAGLREIVDLYTEANEPLSDMES